MKDSSRKKIILLFGALAAIALALVIWGVMQGRSLNATITTEASPLDTKITLNGNKVRNGLNKVKPGSYQIVFEREGFKSETHTTTVGEKGNQYIGVIMRPAVSQFSNWYSAHPKDAKQAETISSHTFDKVQDAQLKDVPVLKYLPLVQPSYRIDSGSSKKYPNDPTKIALYISITTDADKQSALQWLQKQGADPSKLEIIYQKYSY